jgi:hypothetical protein
MGLASRFQQLRRPEKASYMLCTNRNRHEEQQQQRGFEYTLVVGTILQQQDKGTKCTAPTRFVLF